MLQFVLYLTVQGAAVTIAGFLFGFGAFAAKKLLKA